MSEKFVTPYHRAILDKRYDAIVIGSGVGGLGAAALLAKHGRQKVLVLERHYTAGGYTHVFHRPGYEWDVGVHYIGDVEQGTVLRAVFDEVTDGRLQWANMGPVYDKIIIGNDVYELPKGAANLRAYLCNRFPEEETAIGRYFELVKSALSTSLLFHAEKTLPPVLSAVIGPWMRRKFLRFSDRTTREVLEELTSNQKLIAILTGQFGDYGLPPAESSFMVHAMVANHYFEGGFYPVGGSSRIAETIIPIIQAAGGQVLIQAEVEQIVVEGGRAVGVKMAKDGTVLRAPLVISDAGVSNTFGRLLPHDIAESYGLLQQFKKFRPSIAHLCLYVGLKQSAKDLGLPKANLWVYPNEQHEENFAAAIRDPDAQPPLVYISFPAAKDPDFERRHPGHSTIEVITVAPYEWFERWSDTRWKKREPDYAAFKEKLAQPLLEKLYEHVPQVRGKIDVYEMSTPLTTRHFSNYERGEIYGIDHTPNRFRQRLLRPQTPVKGLFLTGQDIVTCGVAGALFGGVLTASAVLRKNLVTRILRTSRERRIAQAA
jgi:all-trans-retinol 13,14-reductase